MLSNYLCSIWQQDCYIQCSYIDNLAAHLQACSHIARLTVAACIPAFVLLLLTFAAGATIAGTNYPMSTSTGLISRRI